MPVFLVPITGPDGKPRSQGEEVPESWDAGYVKALTAEGAVGPQKAWKAVVERNQVEAEARAAEPPLASWGQAELQAHREHEALVAQVEALKGLGIDVSGVEIPDPPPPPPAVPPAIQAAVERVASATPAELEWEAAELAKAVERHAVTAPQVKALNAARHQLAGQLSVATRGGGR